MQEENIRDIVESALGPSGYLDQLSRETTAGEEIRENFDKAYNEIFRG